MPSFVVGDLTRLVRTKIIVCDECGCWRWLGSCDTSGYAKFKLRGKTIQVHRYAFESLARPIPDGLTIDHLNCTLRRCVNPAHFELVTIEENARRANDTRWHDMKYTMDGDRIAKAQCATCLATVKDDRRHNIAPSVRLLAEEGWHD